MSTTKAPALIARHMNPATVTATARHMRARHRRHAVKRFQLVWARRIDTYAVPLTIAATLAFATAMIALGWAARLYQEGVI